MTFSKEDLGLVDDPEEQPIDGDNVPRERVRRESLPQPGTRSVFMLPKDLASRFEQDGNIITLDLFDNALIKIPENQPLRWSVNSRKLGESESKLVYLAQAVGVDIEGKTPTPSDIAVELANIGAGAFFQATVTWNTYCNPKKPIYKDGKKHDGLMGCGQSYRMEAYTKNNGDEVYQIPRGEGGTWFERFPCSGNDDQCGALLSCRLDLENFKPAE